MTKEEQLEKHINNFHSNYVMRDLTRIKTGGVAEYFCEADTIEELINGVSGAITIKEDYMVLGEGSNVLFSDYGYKGLVIKNKTNNLAFLDEMSQIIVDSGVSLKRIVMESCSRELSGMEPYATIPGTIGGAVWSNINVFNVPITNFIKSATILFPKADGDYKVLKKNRDWFEFETGINKLKKIQPKPIILSLKLQLAQNKREDIWKKLSYYKKLGEKNFPLNQLNLKVFSSRYLDGKNDTETIKNLREQKTKTKAFCLDRENPKFINNYRKAKSQEIKDYIESIKSYIREKQGIMLEESFEYFGNWDSMNLEKLEISDEEE
ncbi:MAG: FAD-binding protein [Patescibacteria group bacterium]|jgi:UDP-N-acetylmuramate dehydrogenase